MEKLDLQRFANEEQNAAEETEQENGQNQESAEPEETNETAFRRLIEGEWREEYEHAVGQRIQAAIQQRFRNQADWKKRAEELAPLAEALGKRYDLAPTDIKAMTERLSREKAENEKNTAPNAEASAGDSGREWAMRRYFSGLIRQGEAMKRTFPDFDLAREMRNPVFARMTAPGTGMTVRDAYYALHGEEIRLQSMRLGAWQAGERIASSVLAGASRPVENGMEKPGMANVAMDIRNMDKQSREAYRRRIRSGETIDFVKNI